MVKAVFCSVAAAAAAAAGGGGGAVTADRLAASATDTDSVVSDGSAAQGARDGEHTVPLPEVLARMNADAHPEVIAGRLDPQQVISDAARCDAVRCGVKRCGAE